MKKTAVIICPGRGTYNKDELGYLQRHHAGRADILSQFDSFRTAQRQDTITALDGADRFSPRLHTRGDNASPLIYAASLLDARAISDDYDVLAVTGNSMGWYIALAVASAVDTMGGLEIVNTMGALMQDHMIGGQTIYPFVDENWIEIPGRRDQLLDLIATINEASGHTLDVSIHLGGMLVVAGDDAGLAAFESKIEAVQGRYPMRLPNHAAFHTQLQAPVAAEGRKNLSPHLFRDPVLPLIDGRGAVWRPKATDLADLYDYTLDHQVVETYDFTRAVTVAAKTFAPDVFIVTGPGTTLGSAVAQSLISIRWDGIDSKESFQHRQSSDPVLVAMGRDDQRTIVTG